MKYTFDDLFNKVLNEGPATLPRPTKPAPPTRPAPTRPATTPTPTPTRPSWFPDQNPKVLPAPKALKGAADAFEEDDEVLGGEDNFIANRDTAILRKRQKTPAHRSIVK